MVSQIRIKIIMNKFLIIFVAMILSSCAKDILREALNTYVYYDDEPVRDADILVWKGYEKGFIKETKTDSLGFFNLPEISKYSLGLESHNLSQKILIVKGNLTSDTLSTPSKKYNKMINDTIFLKMK